MRVAAIERAAAAAAAVAERGELRRFLGWWRYEGSFLQQSQG